MEQKLGLSGRFICEIYDRDGNLKESFEIPNVVTKEGKFYLLRAGVVGDMSAITTWYVGLIGTDITPSENDSASTALGPTGSYQEITNYTSVTRVLYTATSDQTNKNINNTDSPASFEANINMTIYGVFITNTAPKLSNNGILLCAGRFTSSKSLSPGETLLVKYTISA